MDLETAAQIADIAGAVGVPLALYFGIQALRDSTRTRRDEIDERRRLYELGVLKDLLDEVDNGLLCDIHREPYRLRQFEYRLEPMRSELDFWWTLMGMDWQDEVSSYLDFKDRWHAKSVEILASAKRRESLPESEWPAWQTNHDRLATEVAAIGDEFRMTVQSRLVQQLKGAITARVEAGRFNPSRRTWWGARRKPVGHVD